jgi:hypothetical protein
LFWWQWDVVDSNASDANARYRPLYSDNSINLDNSYYYRVIAKNSSGISEPSGKSNPVIAHNRMIVDEFVNDAQLFAKSAGVKFLFGDRADRTKEDLSRLQGTFGENIIYKLPGRIDSLCLDVFFTTASRDTNIQFTSGVISEDSSPIVSTREVFEPHKNVYGYYAPARYVIRDIPAEHRFVKIHLADNIQLSRIEISYSSVK